VPVSLSDSLERDLGLGSLERVELLSRLEHAFGVPLSESVLATAETARDLAAALAVARPPETLSLDRLPLLPAGTPAPQSAQTLVDVLEWHAEAHPDRTHIYLCEQTASGREVERAISYGDLLNGARMVAAGLRRRQVVRDESVALMLRTEEGFFHAFFGTLIAGGVPVPLYPPYRADRIEEYARRQAGILRNAEARLLITFGEAERLARLLRGYAPALRDVVLLERLRMPEAAAPSSSSRATDPALIQYTSGSTGDPKGVLLSHANLLANIRAIGNGIEIRPDDIGVSWLPLYHDMGLIGAWLGALYFGVPIALMSPIAFLSRPARWLRTIHAHRATVSPAPNFAFDLCVSKVSDEEIAGLDLASWRLALNGSEPVSPDTIARFTRRFAAYGFRPEAMCPVYGLAECAVGLTISPVGRRPRVDVVSREMLRLGRVTPAGPDDNAPLQFVSCGRPLHAHHIRIVDSSGRPVGERVEGRVEFQGPSVTAGYFRNRDRTRAVMHGRWMDSGDIGYQADGELFITGRQKDLIIQGGRNIYPQEVEEVAGEIEGVRKGCVAAFGLADPSIGTERLIVIAETRILDAARREQLRRAIIDRLVAAIGSPPDVVIITGPGCVLKTSSGKLRRSATRDAYVSGRLGHRRAISLQWGALALTRAATMGTRVCQGAVRAAYTSYLAALMLLTLPPLMALLRLLPPGPFADRAVRRWCWYAVKATALEPQVTGLEYLRAAGPAILACNHASYIDSVVLMAALPTDFRFVAKRALSAYPVTGTVIRAAGHLTIEKADVSGRLTGADEMTARLAAGDSLLVFPEGTFVRSPGILPFRLGAFRAAAAAGRPVVPIALRGTRHVLPDGNWLLHRGTIHLAIGEPITTAGASWGDIVRLRDAVRARIARDAGEPLVHS
jgi:1-acyl-sn-glycerol-3-phosphate acyltransferase